MLPRCVRLPIGPWRKAAWSRFRKLSRESAGDQWAQGRYVARILSVWIDDLQEEAADEAEIRGGARDGPVDHEHEELGRYLSEAEMANVITTVRETSAGLDVRLEVPEGTLLAEGVA